MLSILRSAVLTMLLVLSLGFMDRASGAALAVTNWTSGLGASVQVRVYNVTTATEVVPWTSTGVTERAVGVGSKSTYYYSYGLTGAQEYIVDFKDGQNPEKSATMFINSIESATLAILDDTGTSGVVVAAGSKAGYALSTAGVDAIWDEAQAGHATAGTFGKYLDAQISLISGGGGSPDWTATEKENIRYRLGVDGTATAPATNTPNIGDVGITQAGADKVWSTNSRTITGGTITTNNDKTGYALSTAGVDAILDDTVEGSLTMRQMVKIMASALAGKAAGGGTTTITFTGLDGVTARITATVDANGNRSAVTVNGN